MTGESKIVSLKKTLALYCPGQTMRDCDLLFNYGLCQVHKDSVRSPFLMSGCKVADGYGTMLVISHYLLSI